jgi:hypothetical protein
MSAYQILLMPWYIILPLYIVTTYAFIIIIDSLNVFIIPIQFIKGSV